MPLIVQKFGGTSLGSVPLILAAAERALACQRAGNQVAVVVSAMSGETNRLLGLVQDLTDRPNEREQDVVLATGEQVSIGLLAIAIEKLGGKAKSFLAHQCRILTDTSHSRARILRIDSREVRKAIRCGQIAVIAGFQGVDRKGNVTTLGRGGGDTTAVAVAAALRANACEIYTDVEGVFTADPSICAAARKLKRISYEEMLELASLGAKVLQIRSVEIAMKYGVPLWVKSSFTDAPGTLVCAEETSMERSLVSGVALDRNEAKITIRGVSDKPGIAARVFGALDRKSISVDVIVQNSSTDGKVDFTFTVLRADATKAMDVVKPLAVTLKAHSVDVDEKIAKVSIVGVGMRTHSGVAARLFKTLADLSINILAISTSEIRVSCLIERRFGELAVRALHSEFGLDA